VKKIAVLFSIAFLASCQQAGSNSNTSPTNSTCKDLELKPLIGKDQAVLQTMKFGPDAKVRIIRPGQVVTQDHRLDRTNITIDESGKIAKVYCG